MSSLTSTFVKVFAPVNIAWIKYMGKISGQPTNSSLSLTLATLGTRTIMRDAGASPVLSFEWSDLGYIPPITGLKKVDDFLRNDSIWNELLSQFGFNAQFPKSKIVIQTHNNVPAGTGIATSASAFAALTLAWSAVLAGERADEWIEKYQSGNPKMRRAMAAVSALGSGSSCRSLDGPWVEWNPKHGISVIDGGTTEWIDFVLLIESGPKEVPSSEAHLRVKSSPHFDGRVARAEKRLIDLKLHLKKDLAEISQIQKLVIDEAMDMHDLFHTSVPPFKYMSALSQEVIDAVKTQSFNGVVTMDAGANVHLFVPLENEALCEQWIQKQFPQLKYLKDITGYGAQYE